MLPSNASSMILPAILITLPGRARTQARVVTTSDYRSARRHHNGTWLSTYYVSIGLDTRSSVLCSVRSQSR